MKNKKEEIKYRIGIDLLKNLYSKRKFFIKKSSRNNEKVKFKNSFNSD
jgi:hypothetical protein